jgi:hypothetical protein
MKFLLALYCSVAYLVGPLALHGGNVAVAVDCISNPPDLSKLTYQQGSEAVSAEVVDIVLRKSKPICAGYTTNLINMLRHANLDNDQIVLGVYLLGELQSTDTNSIRFLIEIIDLKASRIDPAIRPPRWGQYPAQGALVKCGVPSINFILEVLPDESSELRRHWMCETLVEIEGKTDSSFKRAEGVRAVQSQIKSKLAAESDAGKKANLELALKELEK